MKKFDLTEFEKLIKMLSAAKIPFETERKKEAEGISISGFPYEHYEIYYPSKAAHWSDAIISFGSYGREKGLLEQYGLVPPEAGDSVEGWLTAEEIFKRWEKDWNEKICKIPK